MHNRDFDEFVRRQQQPPPEIAATDWEKECDEWIQHLKELYTLIDSFLAKYVSSRQIQREYRTIELSEEYIGSYKVQEMVLKVGRQTLHLEPIGTVLIGSKGRVDLVGPAGKTQLLLVDSNAKRPSDLIRVEVGTGGKTPAKIDKPAKQIKWEWRIATRAPERQFVELSQEAFFQLIMELANG